MRISEVLSEKIDPHGGQEVALLISGKKPAAILHDYDEFKKLNPYFLNGRLTYKFDQIGRFDTWVIAQPKEAWRVDKILELLKGSKLDANNSMDTYHRTLGELLGYRKKDIEYWIEHQHSRGYW